jgi:hypothetical protein
MKHFSIPDFVGNENQFKLTIGQHYSSAILGVLLQLSPTMKIAPNVEHVWTRIQVFAVNPAVVTPPHQHTHLLAGPGCYQEVTKDMQIVNKECDGVKGVRCLQSFSL